MTLNFKSSGKHNTQFFEDVLAEISAGKFNPEKFKKLDQTEKGRLFYMATSDIEKFNSLFIPEIMDQIPLSEFKMLLFMTISSEATSNKESLRNSSQLFTKLLWKYLISKSPETLVPKASAFEIFDARRLKTFDDTILHFVCANASFSTIKFFIESTSWGEAINEWTRSSTWTNDTTTYNNPLYLVLWRGESRKMESERREVIRLLIDRGATFKAEEYTHSQKDLDEIVWLTDSLKYRENIRNRAFAILALKKCASSVIGYNGRDVLTLLAKSVWATRWRETIEDAEDDKTAQ